MSGIQVHELSSLMKHSHLILDEMKQLSMKQELTDKEIAWFRQNKEFLSPVLSRLQAVGPSLEGEIRKRQSRRRRQKRKRAREVAEREDMMRREKQMDAWICDVRREEERREKKAQNSRVLSEQISSIQKHLTLLSLLEKLAKARGSSIEPTTPALEAELSRLRERMSGADNESEGDRDRRMFLFNEESGPELPSAQALLKIRNDWDQFVSNEATATRIPIGWVTPASACRHCEAVMEANSQSSFITTFE